MGKFPNGHRPVHLHAMDVTTVIEIAGLGRLSDPLNRALTTE